MLPRFAFRGIIPALRLTQTLAATSKSVINSNIKYSAFTWNLNHRLYSLQTNPEDMTVDFDYVKKATSDSSILIVDVREPDEVKEHGKIPSSINIPLGDVTSVLCTMPDKDFEQRYKRPKPSEDTQIIFYCMIGKRSGKAQHNAINAGYKNVKNYLGSWTDWATKSQ
ncbi:rhodanese domain-containing protein CG4456-like [Ostrinia nubilalis]|uniref:rhodanese domain-containing protein CG4456-like n=1 Tax=Ostrinia furnacalis TaxID=93504 RepID=UPI00103BFD2F|nr:rhodanese domain-containing protein CG4456-like [Ostrinia furnacalis]